MSNFNVLKSHNFFDKKGGYLSSKDDTKIIK